MLRNEEKEALFDYTIYGLKKEYKFLRNSSYFFSLSPHEVALFRLLRQVLKIIPESYTLKLPANMSRKRVQLLNILFSPEQKEKIKAHIEKEEWVCHERNYQLQELEKLEDFKLEFKKIISDEIKLLNKIYQLLTIVLTLPENERLFSNNCMSLCKPRPICVTRLREVLGNNYHHLPLIIEKAKNELNRSSNTRLLFTKKFLTIIASIDLQRMDEQAFQSLHTQFTQLAFKIEITKHRPAYHELKILTVL